MKKCAFESYIKSLVGCETLQYYYEPEPIAAIESSPFPSSTIISPDAAPFVPRTHITQSTDLNNNGKNSV